MSTEASFQDVLIGLQGCNFEPELSSSESRVSLQTPEGEWDSRSGYFGSIVDGLELSHVRSALFLVRTLGRVTAHSTSMRISWRSEFQKFHDKSRISNELAVVAIGRAIQSVGTLKASFAEQCIKEEVTLRVSVVSNGRRINVDV